MLIARQHATETGEMVVAAALELSCQRVHASTAGEARPDNERSGEAMPTWAWVLIIVLLVLLLTGGVYVRR